MRGLTSFPLKRGRWADTAFYPAFQGVHRVPEIQLEALAKNLALYYYIKPSQNLFQSHYKSWKLQALSKGRKTLKESSAPGKLHWMVLFPLPTNLFNLGIFNKSASLKLSLESIDIRKPYCKDRLNVMLLKNRTSKSNWKSSYTGD